MAKEEVVRKAINKSIEHHQRMNTWVRSLSVEDLHRSSGGMLDEMRNAIGEMWKSYDCALCKMFSFRSAITIKDIPGCSNCPLGKMFGWCSGTDAMRGVNRWLKMHMSRTWAEWLTHSDALIEQLKSL